MNDLTSLLVTVIAIAGMFLLLMVPHEGGHFLLAKLFKVRVIEFSIGAGTRLWSTTRNGTLYALRAVPVLGYVRMGGMDADDFDDPTGFHSKTPGQRILILAAGPAANFLVAMLIVTVFNLTQLNSDPGKVAGVLPGSPAASAGFQVGDRITAVNGQALTRPDQVRNLEQARPGVTLVLSGVHANGGKFSYVVAPDCSFDPCRAGVGISPLMDVPTALKQGAEFPYVAVRGIVQGLWSLVSGAVPGGLFGPQGLTGPIGIADATVQSVALGPADYMLLVALLSVALGFTNLLPLLALDGGRIVVVVIEWLRRRPFDRTSELNFQRWGLVALLSLAVLISFLDIQRIATGQFPGMH